MRTALLLTLAVLLSGCVGDIPGAQDGDATEPGGAPEASNDAEKAAEQAPRAPEPEPGQRPAEPEPHGDVQRTDGETTTELSGTKWVASKRVTLRNGVGDAARIDVGLDVDYADVTVVPADVGAYTYTFDLHVHAETEAQAQDGMQRLDLGHTDQLLLGTLTLDTWPHIPPTNPLPVGSGLEPHPHLSYELVVEVPYHLAYGLDLDADYTDLVSGTLDWTDLDLDADYSVLAFAGAPGLAELDVDLDYSELAVRDITPVGGSWDVDIDYSDVVLATDAGAGYDVQGDADYSDVEILLPGVRDLGDPEEEDEVHYRTGNYASAAVKVDVSVGLDYSDLVVRAA